MSAAAVSLASLPPKISRRSVCWGVAAVSPLVLGGVIHFAQHEPTLFIQTWIGLVLATSAIVGAYVDARWRMLPNWLTYTTAAWGLALNGLSSFLGSSGGWVGGVGVSASIGGLAALFAVMLIVFSFTGGGAGDVKYAGAVGALVGFQQGVEVMLYGFLVAGVFVLAAALLRLGPLEISKLIARGVTRLCCAGWSPAVLAARDADQLGALLRSQTPLGPFFAVGSLVVVLSALN